MIAPLWYPVVFALVLVAVVFKVAANVGGVLRVRREWTRQGSADEGET
jgi:hypothetical protein